MRVLAICSSDMLGIPAVLQLKRQNALVGVAVPIVVATQLVPMLKSWGIADQEIVVLTKQDLDIELQRSISERRADAIFVFTFPWLIPSSVLKLLPGRCINFHFGLLPKYKGADAIFWQIKNGEHMGGIGIHVMTNNIDSGPVLFNAELPITHGETYGLYTQRLGGFAAEQVNKILYLPLNDVEQAIVTNAEPALYLKKPTEQQLMLNWQTQTAKEIENLVNAANPRYGGAITIFRQMPMKILEVAAINVSNPADIAPGTIVYADATYGLVVACLQLQYLKISVVQIQEGYLSGLRLFSMGVRVGERLG